LIPRLKPYLGVMEFLAALRFPRRNDVERFETAFALEMGQKHAIAFPYGRTGLILLLEALGLKDREIICPAYTCVVVPHAIVYSGNKPVFVDCAIDDFNMDLDLVEKSINEKTGAIIATSVFGYPVNLDKLDKIRKKYQHIYIIQDCAHSFSAEWKGRPVQCEGVAAVFGLNISKMITSVFGGMITTDDTTTYEKLMDIRARQLEKSGWAKEVKRLMYLAAVYMAFCSPAYLLVNLFERVGLLNMFTKYYDESRIDMPKDYLVAMTTVEARVGIENLKRLKDIYKLRRQAAEYYLQQLKNINGIILPKNLSGATFSHFVIQVEKRDSWLKKGVKKGVQLGQLIEYSIPEMKAYGSLPSERYPNAAKYARCTINLPVFGGEKISRKVISKIL